MKYISTLMKYKNIIKLQYIFWDISKVFEYKLELITKFYLSFKNQASNFTLNENYPIDFYYTAIFVRNAK